MRLTVAVSTALLLLTTTLATIPASLAVTAPARKPATAPANKPATADELVKSMVDAGNKSYAEQKYDQAAASFKSALKVSETQQGLISLLNRAMLYSNLGTTYFAQKKFPEAEAEYKSAIDLQEKLLSSHHAVVADTLHHYAALLRRMNRTEEADRIGTHAEMLKVGSISGKDTDFKFERAESSAVQNTPESSPSFSMDVNKAASEPKVETFAINRIVKMTQQDRSLLENPTTTEQPVYREETYYEGGMWNPLAGVFVGGEQKKRQVLDHYEKVSLSSSKDLSYVASVADLERRYQLSQSSIKQLLDAINSGGAAVELANGWLMVTNEDLNPNYWFSGMEVAAATRPTESAMYIIRTADKSKEFVARRIAVLSR